MKGQISADHIPVSKYQLLVVGLPPITFTEISGIEEELQTTDLPDKTTASGGETGPIDDFTAMVPVHETIQIAALESWYSLCKDPVSPAYKKEGTLILQSISGSIVRSYAIINIFPRKRVLPDLEMENEGEIALMEWTFRADEIIFLT